MNLLQGQTIRNISPEESGLNYVISAGTTVYRYIELKYNISDKGYQVSFYPNLPPAIVLPFNSVRWFEDQI